MVRSVFQQAGFNFLCQMSTGATFLGNHPLLYVKALLLTMFHLVACLGTLSTRLDN
jgi:hypothetical protein